MDKLTTNNNESIQELVVGTTSVPKFFVDYLKLNRTPDIMPVMFKLAHAGANSNKDFFKEDELLFALKSTVNKPLDWEHDREDTIGSIVKSYFVKVRNGKMASIVSSDDSEELIELEISMLKDENMSFAHTNLLSNEFRNYAEANNTSVEELINIAPDEKSFILSIGVVWSQIHKEKAELMIMRSKNSMLTWSMEAFYKEFECSSCGTVAKKEKEQCACISNRFTKNGANRILKNINFAGAGVVSEPADESALNVALGSKEVETSMEVNKMDSYRVFATKEELDAYVLEQLSEQSLKEENISLEATVASLSEQNAALGSEIENTKASLEAKVVELDSKVQEYETAIASLKEKVASYEAKEKEALGLARLTELKNAGMAIAEEKEISFASELSEKTETEFNSFLEIISATFVSASKRSKEEVVEETITDTVEATIPTSMQEDEVITVASVTVDSEDKLDELFLKSSRVRIKEGN